MILHGRYDHSLDEKGRVSLPADLRNKICAEGNTLFITRDLAIDYAMSLYTPAIFNQLAESYLAKDQDDSFVASQIDFFVGKAREVEVNGSGRIQIPKELRDELGLKPGDPVIVSGLGNKVTVRPAKIYEQQVGPNPPRRQQGASNA